MRMAVITAKVVLEQKKGHRIRNLVLEGPQFCTLCWCRPSKDPNWGDIPPHTDRTSALEPYHSVLVLL